MSSLTNDMIINKRLNEHESENNNTIPSITRCANDLFSFLNAYINNDKSLESKRYTILNTLESYKILLERLPTTEDSLNTDLQNYVQLQDDYQKQIIELTEKKQTLEKEMEEALVYLKEMNKIEKKSIEVNQYETSQEIQQKIDATVHHIEHIELEIQNLKKKMEKDGEALNNLYTSFIKLKNEIMGVDADDEDGMDVEE